MRRRILKIRSSRLRLLYTLFSALRARRGLFVTAPLFQPLARRNARRLVRVQRRYVLQQTAYLRLQRFLLENRRPLRIGAQLINRRVVSRRLSYYRALLAARTKPFLAAYTLPRHARKVVQLRRAAGLSLHARGHYGRKVLTRLSPVYSKHAATAFSGQLRVLRRRQHRYYPNAQRARQSFRDRGKSKQLRRGRWGYSSLSPRVYFKRQRYVQYLVTRRRPTGTRFKFFPQETSRGRKQRRSR
jgi:hypothetical protein